jgi:DNA-directed RNA polymerase subunit RPC12/RpoP
MIERCKNPKNHPAYIDGSSLRKYFCIDCKINEISFNTYKIGNGRCTSCAHIELYKDPSNHPAWQGGKSFEPYPLGWTRTFKEQIRYRDGYKCQECGCHEVDCNSKLDVHHIDYNKENLNPKNLISLCKKCHTKTNFNRDYWFEYFKKSNTIEVPLQIVL